MMLQSTLSGDDRLRKIQISRMKNRYLFADSYYLISFTQISCQTQNTDNLYKKPLVDVLKEIQTRFKVQIKYSEPQVKDRWVNYADWRFSYSVDETLTNVLTLWI